MINVTFVCAIHDLTIPTDLKEGFIITPHDENIEYPSIRLTNNKAVIASLIDNEACHVMFGQIECTNILNSDLVAYGFSSFDETSMTGVQFLNLHFNLIRMFFFCLWTIRDNSADFSLGLIYYQKNKSEIEGSNNYFSAHNYTCTGKTVKSEFTTTELESAGKILKTHFHISGPPKTIANTHDNGRIAIGNYFIQHARSSHDLGIKMVSYCSALETLFSNDNSELSHKLAERIARYIYTTVEDRIQAFKLVKKCYGFRSRIVHGGTFKPEGELELGETIKKMDELCRLIVRTLLKPRNDNPLGWSADDHEEYFLKLLMS